MIKSLDGINNNAYRILKVLANQDFLAIDYFSNYYILSPLLIKAKLDRRFNVSMEKIKGHEKQENHIVQPIQIIQIDSIAYSVFYAGKTEVFFLKNADQIKKQNTILIFGLFSDSILTILKHLLRFKLKEVKKYLNVKNFVIFGSRLYLLLISRERSHKLSLKRSERSSSKSPQSIYQNSLENYLDNQLSIIRQFGLVLWQCFHQKYYPLVQQFEKHTLISTIIKEMIKEKITFQYLSLKISEMNIVKKSTRFTISNKNEKLKTQTSQNGQRRILRSLDFQKALKFQTQSVGPNIKTPLSVQRPKLSMHKRILTTHTDYQINKNQYHSEKSKLILLQGQQDESKLYQRQSFQKKAKSTNNKQKQRYKDWLGNHKFQTSFRQRIKKQGQIAREKFRISVQSNHSQQDISRMTDDTILKIKLMHKLKKFRKENKVQISQLPLLSNQKSEGQLIQSQRIQLKKQIQKKLQFSQSTHKETIKSMIGCLPDQSSKDSLVQAKQQKINLNNLSLVNKIEIDKNDLSNKQTLSDQKNLPFQQLNQSSLVQTKQMQNRHPSKCNQETSKINTKIIKQYTSTETNTILKNQRPTSQQTNNKKCSFTKKMRMKEIQNTELDQIQQIKLGVVQKVEKNKYIQDNLKKEKNNNYLIQNKLEKNSYGPQTKLSKQKYDSIQQSIQEYITLINIMGNICVKSVKSNKKIQRLQWHKSIYFIYERFCYERQNIIKSFTIGACVAFRKNKKVNYDQWQEWLKSANHLELSQKLANQNIKIRRDLNKFATNMLLNNKLNRKIQYYVRNRQKILDSGNKATRISLSKFAVDQVVQLYNSVAQNNLTKAEVLNFIWDCLFALKIIAELDNFIEQSHWVVIRQYQTYNYKFNDISNELEQLYCLYFNSEQTNDSLVSKV